MKTVKSLTQRSGLLFAVLAFGAAIVLPVLGPAVSVDAAQLTSRTLTMTSTADGNTSTDANGTAVTAGAPGNGAETRHSFTYTHPGNPSTIGSVLIQYCTTPLFGTDCVAPTGLDVSTVSSIQTESGYTASDWAIDTTTNATQASGVNYFAADDNSCDGSGVGRTNCILISDTTSPTGDDGAITLTFGSSGSWIKNPTSNGPFYVRITTFSDTFTTEVDNGAVAGSVNEQIDITARVQEKLNFSVAGAPVDPSTTCVALSGSGAETLGSGGILDNTTASYTNSYFRLSTNASGGTLVQYSGDTLKTTAGDEITALTTTPTASSAGTPQFGLTIDSADATQYGYSFTHLTRTAPYNADATFAFDTTSLTSPKTVATAASGTTVTCDTGSVKYVGNIGTTTKAGIYRTTITYFATPTF